MRCDPAEDHCAPENGSSAGIGGRTSEFTRELTSAILQDLTCRRFQFLMEAGQLTRDQSDIVFALTDASDAYKFEDPVGDFKSVCEARTFELCKAESCILEQLERRLAEVLQQIPERIHFP